MGTCYDKMRDGLSAKADGYYTVVEVSNVANYLGVPFKGQGNLNSRATWQPVSRIPFDVTWFDFYGRFASIVQDDGHDYEVTDRSFDGETFDDFWRFNELVRSNPDIHVVRMVHFELRDDKLGALGAHIHAINCATGMEPRMAGLHPEKYPSCVTFDSHGIGRETALDNSHSVILHALRFINCRNVQIVEHKHPEKLQKARTRNGKLPFVEYKRIAINPINPANRHVYKLSGHSGAKQRFHICRGHFKDYSDGKGLFGKVNGVFWWDASVKGSDSLGVIRNSYAIEGLS